jgi:hypothetical protein
MMTSGGNRNPVNADLGGRQVRGRVDSFASQGCHDPADD